MYTLDEVVPWGRSLEEYRRMFALTPSELAGSRMLGCGDGPASFNAELTATGGSVVSVDPIYVFDAAAIGRRVDEVFDTVMAQTLDNLDEFVWGPVVADPDHLARLRRGAMDRFLADYPAGRAGGRYVPGELPALPFADGEFDIAVCSHFLFLYSQHLSFEFHLASVAELCRVAAEVRVFPLLQLGAVPSPHLDGVLAAFDRRPDLAARVETVDYEFQ
ncbi:MAG: SAM-dependent methyltransferase, partial [Acidimicrobiia bacterium]|nr:SAM-dependent methyltransferase [Acidimicrobiia bacterium]